MKTTKTFYYVGTMLLSLPIWLWLMHEILERVEATELMWFLFWVYVPLIVLLGVARGILDAAEKP